MDLPKNITQIGESDQRCKVYVEDYVISYIKQMNRQAENRNVAVALYGIRKEENDVSYVFFYGAGRVQSIQKEVRHLSQAQNQEIEKLRRRYFPEYQFLGYRMLNGDMVEGFHICEQGTSRYINGYACFYEKNDVMLAYMLDSRKEEVPPENVDQEKYDRVRQRQEERRAQYRGSLGGNGDNSRRKSFSNQTDDVERYEDRESAGDVSTAGDVNQMSGVNQAGNRNQMSGMNGAGNWNQTDDADRMGGGQVSASYGQARNRQGKVAQFRRQSTQPRKAKNTSRSLKMMRVAAVGMFLLLCVLGIATLNDSYNIEDIQTAARKLITEFTEQKIPDSDAVEETAGQVNTLVTEDKLTEAIRQENEAQQQSGEASNTETPETQSAETQPSETEQIPASEPATGSEQAGGAVQSTGTGQAAATEQTPTSEQPTVQESAVQESQTEEATQETAQQTSAPVTYVIKRGDTLTAISVRKYGTDAMVDAICELNNIKNPDDILFGQKILLP